MFPSLSFNFSFFSFFFSCSSVQSSSELPSSGRVVSHHPISSSLHSQSSGTSLSHHQSSSEFSSSGNVTSQVSSLSSSVPHSSSSISHSTPLSQLSGIISSPHQLSSPV